MTFIVLLILSLASDGSIVVQDSAPRAKTNPTWICPDGHSGVPGTC